MFRITEDPSSGSLVQCLAKNHKNDSVVSVDNDKIRQTDVTKLIVTFRGFASGRDSAVGIATRYGLVCLGVESR